MGRKYQIKECLTPFCKNRRYQRGQCQSCSKQRLRATKKIGPHVEIELMQLGLLLPAANGSYCSYGESVSLEVIGFSGWLPFAARTGFRGETLTDIRKRAAKAIPRQDIGFDMFAKVAAAKFSGMPDSELRKVAESPTCWRPGSEERKIIYRLRSHFGIAFGEGANKGIHHPGDDNLSEVGTILFVRNAE